MARKPDFAAMSRTHDMHRLTLLIRSCARSICLLLFKKKVSYSTQCCPAKALAWMTQIRTRIMKTPARLLICKEQQGICLRQFYKRKVKIFFTMDSAGGAEAPKAPPPKSTTVMRQCSIESREIICRQTRC